MKIFFAFVLILIVCFRVFSQENNSANPSGKIVDAAGSSIENATVKIISNSNQTVICQTETNGKFSCGTNFGENFTLVIEAQGFSILRQKFGKLQDFPPDAVFTLIPESVREDVVVTTTRSETRLSETPASIVSLSKEEIATTAAPAIDDVLRQVAGFSLFRRSGSRYANPTAQGASLRGVGASGASRSLISLDGVPLNDVFGGWIQWSRVPTISIERVEVLRGGASSLYGSDSLSGAINILSKKTTEKYSFSGEIYGGSQRTVSGSTAFGFTFKDFTADFVAANFQTRGYVLTDERERGAADSFAGSKNTNLSARLAKNFGDAANVFLKTSYFGEARTNGTPAQINRTHLREFVFGGDTRVQSSKFKVQSLNFDWRLFGGTQVYDQTFSAVSADRNSESLTRLQRVPAQNVGFSGQVSGVFFKNQTVVAGVEAREVRGTSDEVGFSNNRATNLSAAGGREKTFGVFLQDFAKIGSRFVLAGSARFDAWRNFDASSRTRILATNQSNIVNFPTRRETAISPQISMLFQATNNFALFAVWSKSFRAPTLNELYRSFRVGNVNTLANENLRAERAANFEAGANFNRKNFFLRGNFFVTEISKPVSNVTVSVTPNLITRQRQNAGRTLTRGAEIEAETRLRNINFSVGYLFADSRFTDFPANRALENLRVPQTARQQLTFQTRYVRRDWSFALQGRASSAQFDDDLNLFRLEPYFQLDAFASKKLKEKLEIFAAVENVFNARYSIGRTPNRTVSSPTNARLGIRWN